MATAHAGSLTDCHVLDLSRRITSEDQLKDLGIKALGLEEYMVEGAKNNSSTLDSAAHKLLTTWLRGQPDRQTAYTSLCSALKQSGLNSLVTLLEQWVVGGDGHGHITTERFETIQHLTRRSFSTKPFCLVPDKEWNSKPGKVDLRKIYTELAWSTKNREPSGTKRKLFDDYEFLLKEVKLGEDDPLRILVQGEGGMGKTTVSKHMAISWADNTSQVLGRFHITFHIALKKVKVDTPIENIIVEQHCELEGNQVSPEEIKNILEGKSAQKVLIVIDGHDEYKPGTNSDIDRVIMKRSLGNCSLILTSRETEQISEVKDHMDVEAEIQGFQSENVTKYIKQSLGSEENSEELLQQAESSELCHSIHGGGYIFGFGFFQIPIFLNMICVLFKSNFALPRTKTDIMRGMVNRYIAREDGRKGKKSTIDEESVLVKLGKLAWTGLMENKFIFSKDEVLHAAGEDALELGLLIGTEDPHPSEEEADMLCFPHLLFQEFVAAHYIAQLNKELLESLFSKWGYVLRHQDVVKFACVLSNQTDRLLEVIYAALINYLKPTDIERVLLPTLSQSHHENAWYQQFLRSLERELSEKMQFDAFHNKYFNYTTTEDQMLFIPSQFYVFDDNTPHSEDIEWKRDDSVISTKAGCLIYVKNSNFVMDVICVLKHLHNFIEVAVECMYVGSTMRGDFLPNTMDHDEEMKLLKQGLKLGDRTNVVALSGLQLSQSALKYITRQLGACKNLTSLFLDGIQGAIPMALGESIAAMTSLKSFDIGSCRMTDATIQKMMLGLSQCFALERIVFGEKITGNLAHFFGGPGHPGFPSLTQLSFMGTQLSIDNIDILSDAIEQNKIPNLKIFYLERNNLTDMIQTLFVPRGHPALAEVAFDTCSLSRDDVEHIFKTMKSFVKCKYLTMSGNILTGVVGIMCSSIGLPFTESLILHDCDLGKADFKYMSNAILNGKLPKLGRLDLSKNDTRDLKPEVEELVKACAAAYSDRMFRLYLSVDNWVNPENLKEFVDKMNSMCADTAVRIRWNIDNFSEGVESGMLRTAFPPGLFDGPINPQSIARMMSSLIVDVGE